ncbi:MAG: OB-fold domain-containing protein [Acidimicrobiales bacterium]|nr:OB-fold domain-containing protein [Acidimicrobiales bacterium]
MTIGIVSWGVYLPYWRLRRSAIGEALGGPAGRGTRRVASYDEDTTTMGVEAARRALASVDGARIGDLVFSTPAPAYLDKSNAAAVHAALALDDAVGSYDAVGSVRAAVGAWRSAEALAGDDLTLAVLSDLRSGPAGGPDERDAGDGAVALVFGDDRSRSVAATVVGRGRASAEFLDRWRLPGEDDSRTWEDRFGQEVYGPLVEAAFADAVKQAGVVPEAVDHLVVAGLNARAVAAARTSLGVRAEAVVPDRAVTAGNLGAAQAGFLLADVLDRARPGEVVVVVVVADGADAVVLEIADGIDEIRAARTRSGLRTVDELVGLGRDDLPYARFLTWRGRLRREPARRPDPERPGAPATWRSGPWKNRFAASRCEACGFRHLPPTRVCLACHAVDRMRLERLADTPGRVATFTIDHLAYSLSPPVVGAVVDFEGGGRYRCEMTDVDPDAVAIGIPVEMVFRRLHTAQGVHNYFWKARPVDTGPAAADDEGSGR